LIALFSVTVAAAPQTPEQQAVHFQEKAQRLYASGQYQDGINLAKQAVAFGDQVLSPEHPAVAVSLQTLGQLYLAAGNYDLAQSTQQRALALREKVLGPEHPDTASALVGLADAYWASFIPIGNWNALASLRGKPGALN
jgi:tetratricopeptide (TPR) repeat protein